MKDAQNKKTGYVSHTAPFGGGGGGPAWGSAYVIMPWAYFCYYGDTILLEQHYPGMKKWVEYLTTRTDENGIIVREEPDGWCLGDWCTPQKIELPESLVNTAYYYHCAELLSKIASVLGKTEDVHQFNQLMRSIKSNFNKAFFNPATNQYWEGRQGVNVFPLAFGLVDEEKRQAVFNVLLSHLESIDYHFDTGILATPLLLKVLSDFRRTDVAYRIMNQRSFPGFHYLLDNRHTCLWENWKGGGSRNHPMFGSVVAWFYNTLAGIRIDESYTGMSHFIIEPQPVEDLSFCNCSYESLHGIIRSEWSQTPEIFNLTIEIPANTTATVCLPFGNQWQTISSGIYNFTVNK
jgi:alpha-L-rhamnosidase